MKTNSVITTWQTSIFSWDILQTIPQTDMLINRRCVTQTSMCLISWHSCCITRLMGPTWAHLGWQDPGGPHVGPTNFGIWDMLTIKCTAANIEPFWNRFGPNYRHGFQRVPMWSTVSIIVILQGEVIAGGMCIALQLEHWIRKCVEIIMNIVILN